MLTWFLRKPGETEHRTWINADGSLQDDTVIQGHVRSKSGHRHSQRSVFVPVGHWVYDEGACHAFICWSNKASQWILMAQIMDCKRLLILNICC